MLPLGRKLEASSQSLAPGRPANNGRSYAGESRGTIHRVVAHTGARCGPELLKPRYCLHILGDGQLGDACALALEARAAMPLFHLHLLTTDGPIPDREGAEFVDLAAARKEAISSARWLLSAEVLCGEMDLGPAH